MIILASLMYSIFVQFVGGSESSWSTDMASKLVTDLTSNKSYHRFVRPAYNIDVTVEFGISSLIDLDIVTQKLSVVGFLLLAWKDDRLAWNAGNYDNLTDVYVTMSDIWVPPIVLNNAADKLEVLSDDRNIASIPLRVLHNGIVIWLAPISFQAACDVNIQNYPFDSQLCSLLVSSWMFSATQLNLINGATKVNTDLYQENGEWILASSATRSTSREIHNQPMSAIEFEIVYERKYGYYVINMVLPVVILALLGSLVFLLPVQSGEKNGFSLTILLALSVVLTIVSDSIPTTSTHICILSLYLLTTFFVCSLEVVITVLTVRCFHKHEIGYPLPDIWQKTMRACLVHVFCYSKPRDDSETNTTTDDDSNLCLMQQISIINVGKQDAASDERKLFTKRDGTQNDVTENDNRSDTKHVDRTRLYTYQDLAIVIDKLSFVIFFVLTVIVTITFMVALTNGSQNI